MKKYWEIAKMNIQVSTAYRLETINWTIISAISTIISAILFFNVSKTGSLNNYNPSQISAYILLSFCLERFLYWYFCFWFGESIKKGGLSSYLLKPYNLIADHVISEFSRKILFTIPYIFIAIFLFTIFNSKINTQFGNILMFIPVFLLAIIISISFTMLLSFAAFYTINNHSIVNLFFYIVPLVGGRAFPIDILPKPFFEFLNILPFPYAFFYPLKILTADLSFLEIRDIFLIQIFWVIVLLIINRIVFKKGLKLYDSAGN